MEKEVMGSWVPLPSAGDRGETAKRGKVTAKRGKVTAKRGRVLTRLFLSHEFLRKLREGPLPAKIFTKQACTTLREL
jgi:hypothetical protein